VDEMRRPIERPRSRLRHNDASLRKLLALRPVLGHEPRDYRADAGAVSSLGMALIWETAALMSGGALPKRV